MTIVARALRAESRLTLSCFFVLVLLYRFIRFACLGAVYVPAVMRFSCFRNGPSPSGGPIESPGMKKNSPLPTWLLNDSAVGQQFNLCYTSLPASVANGLCCGRTKADLGEGTKGVDRKLRMKYRRARHRYIRVLKLNVENAMLAGDTVEAYDNFLRLCCMNLEKQHEIYLDDPENVDSESEYVPSLIECLPSIHR